jgi:hypothetical protein
MRWRCGIAVVLVVTLAASSCRTTPEPPAPVDEAGASWASEAVPWIQQFLVRVEELGGIGALPFLDPDIVVDVRTLSGHVEVYEGVSRAMAFFDKMRVVPGSSGERLSFGDVYYVDATGIVVPGGYDRSIRPDVSPPILGHMIMFLEVGPRGIERLEHHPSSASWRQGNFTPWAPRADDAERIAATWAAAWSGDDPHLVERLYAHDAVLEDHVTGVDVAGVQTVADRWALSPTTTWEVIERDGTPAVHLWPPKHGADARPLVMLALVRGDVGNGCPGEFAVRWEVDTDNRVMRERRLRSVADARRCVSHVELPDGWWTGRAVPGADGSGEEIPADCDAAASEDLETVTERIVVSEMTIEICNGTPVLAELVMWGLSRFYLADMQLPVVHRVTFTSFSDFCPHVAGRTIFDSDRDPETGRPIADVVLCLDSDDVYMDERGAEPSPLTRFMVLHELAHAWIMQNLDPAVRDDFVAWLDLPTWNDRAFDWEHRGVEWAASFISWGLMDVPMPLFELDVPPIEQRVDGFLKLTERQPLQPR